MSQNSAKNTLPLHHFLFGMFPVIFLYSHNTGKIPPVDILRILAIVIIFALLSNRLLSALLKHRRKAALLVTIFLLYFFFYGHYYNALLNCTIAGWRVGRNMFLLPISLVPVFAAGWFAVRTRQPLINLTKILNIVAISLVAIPLCNVAVFALAHRSPRQTYANAASFEMAVTSSEKPDYLPNIYYIILDGYARADVLKDIFQYDNSTFIKHLTDIGFYVVPESTANYAQTPLSLASSLNMQYLHHLSEDAGNHNDSIIPLGEMIKDNAVFHFLRNYGYETIAFASTCPFTDIKNADIFFSKGLRLNEFELELVKTTFVAAIQGAVTAISPLDEYRRQMLYPLDHLPDVAVRNGPFFVFAHIICPHAPFVFNSQGQHINPDLPPGPPAGCDFGQLDQITRKRVQKYYGDQLTFLNQKVSTIIAEILSKSATPPIIIFQADHGSQTTLIWDHPDDAALAERMPIFNACYLPGFDYTELPQTLTPVNTFRIIFNHYFSAKYELLPNENYFSSTNHPYRFTNVTDIVTR